MTYKTLGGGLDLSLSMESKSNSLPLMMSAGGVSEGSSRDSGGESCKRVRDASIYASKKYRSSFYS